jgi:hypothetical protein
MRGEVQAHIEDIDDRVSLARTCKQLLADMNVPRLPPPWRGAWTLIRKEYHGSALVLQYAFLEMIRIGVPTWPGAFREAALDIVYHRETGPWLSWWWSGPEYEYICTAWFPLERKWRTGHKMWRWPIFQNGQEPVYSASSLDQLLEVYATEWREFVAQPRPHQQRGTHHYITTIHAPLVHVFHFDEDTPT